jgi:hypothetical protein
MKIRPVGAEMFHVDGRTVRKTDRWADRTKFIVTFRNFAKAPEMPPDTQNCSLRDISCYAVHRFYTMVKWEEEVFFWYGTENFHHNGAL